MFYFVNEHSFKHIHRKLDKIMASLQDIQSAVADQTSVDQSVITLLQGLTQQIKDAQASNDPAAMDQVVANIQANTKMLSDAVAQNTPASK